MDKILLERKNIYEYIKDMLISCKTSFSFIDDKQYHHNSCYEVVPSICQYGILSLSDLNKMKKYSFFKKLVSVTLGLFLVCTLTLKINSANVTDNVSLVGQKHYENLL